MVDKAELRKKYFFKQITKQVFLSLDTKESNLLFNLLNCYIYTELDNFSCDKSGNVYLLESGIQTGAPHGFSMAPLLYSLFVMGMLAKYSKYLSLSDSKYNAVVVSLTKSSGFLMRSRNGFRSGVLEKRIAALFTKCCQNQLGRPSNFLVETYSNQEFWKVVLQSAKTSSRKSRSVEIKIRLGR